MSVLNSSKSPAQNPVSWLPKVTVVHSSGIKAVISASVKEKKVYPATKIPARTIIPNCNTSVETTENIPPLIV